MRMSIGLAMPFYSTLPDSSDSSAVGGQKSGMECGEGLLGFRHTTLKDCAVHSGEIAGSHDCNRVLLRIDGGV